MRKKDKVTTCQETLTKKRMTSDPIVRYDFDIIIIKRPMILIHRWLVHKLARVEISSFDNRKSNPTNFLFYFCFVLFWVFVAISILSPKF